MTTDDVVKALLAGKSTVQRRVGRFVGADGQYAQVDISGARISVPFACAYVPEVNEPVLLDTIDGTTWLAGPSGARPGFGVVLSVADDKATVETAFGPREMPFHFGDTLEVGDFVSIVWNSGPSCFKLSTSPDDITPPPSTGGGGGEVKTAEFRALDAGSTDRGSARWWTDQVWASNSTFGAWFYGSQIKDTIPAGAQFVSLQIYVSWSSRYGDAPRWILHDQMIKVGVPAVSGYTEWAPAGGYQTPPDAVGWFNALKAGGPWAGVGFNQGGKNIFNSLAADGLSGALKIQWR